MSPDVDLNLLRVFDALIEERHLGRAAARLGMAPGAMGPALTRLRRLVQDPVLVRAQGKMVPTPRAWELHGPIQRILGQVDALLAAPPRFDPKSSHHTFTLATTDYAEFVLLPRLIQKLADLSPGVRIAVRPLSPDAPFAELQSGRVDLVLGELELAPEGAARQVLFSERPVVVLRKHHPRIREKAMLSPAQFEALEFVDVVPRAGDAPRLGLQLQGAGLTQRVALTVPSFLVAPMLVAQTDHAAVLPERVARHFASILPLRVLELPVRLPGQPLAMIWRKEAEASGVDWLRAVISGVGKAL
jgi:DNA-binding transcriptional LysR family regulator